MASIVDRNNEDRLSEIDKEVKNRFRWSWLEREVKIGSITVCLGEYIRKVDLPGKALCTLCNDTINYASRRVKTIEEHCLTKKHGQKLRLKKENHVLTSVKPADMNYGLHPMFRSSCPVREPVVKPVVPVVERVYQQQAMILGVVAENSLPLSMAPVILEVAKELSKEKKSLASNTMDRTAASYKMTHGLQKTIIEKTLENIRQCPFSLNMDESTSSSHGYWYFAKRNGTKRNGTRGTIWGN